MTSNSKHRFGVLLVNLGTPDSPEVPHVRKYLREFLMDKFVIDIPYFFRFLLVNLIIAPFRGKKSAVLYKKIWTERGSPLKFHLQDLRQKLEVKLGDSYKVTMAMRYQSPSIQEALLSLKNSDCSHIWVLPLYPQYAESSTRSTLEKVREEAKRLEIRAQIFIREHFFNDPEFIKASVENMKPYMQPDDRVLFSFHGIPERHIHKVTSDCKTCLTGPCKMVCTEKCYRGQSYKTAELIAQGLNVKNYSVSFQSRLGRDPWIKPYTDHVIAHLASEKHNRLVVHCPSFTADCLETIEEIEGEAQHQYQELGGGEFKFVPCLNSHELWVETIAKWAKNHFTKHANIIHDERPKC